MYDGTDRGGNARLGNGRGDPNYVRIFFLCVSVIFYYVYVSRQSYRVIASD